MPLASHPRSFERYKKIINPLHRSYSRLSQKAKYIRIYEAIKNLHPVMADFLLKNQTLGEDPQKTAYELFTLIKRHSRGMLISIAHECIRRKSPRLRTFLSYLTTQPAEASESVLPQHTELLTITYTPRSLEVYDEGES